MTKREKKMKTTLKGVPPLSCDLRITASNHPLLASLGVRVVKSTCNTIYFIQRLVLTTHNLKSKTYSTSQDVHTENEKTILYSILNYN